jgi:D-sedoheptulose 7-phosphate isomerase
MQNDHLDTWRRCFSDAQATLDKFVSQPGIWEKLTQFSEMLLKMFQGGGTVFSCGNGGSHCDAMHFAEEWTGRYRKDRKPLGALALGDASHMSCVGNDYGFEHVFSRQIQGLGRKGDLLLLLSTSGNSKNQLLAVEAAKAKGLSTIALLGRDGGKLKDQVDLPIIVPAQTSDRIQEIHIKIIHTVIETVERRLFPELY